MNDNSKSQIVDVETIKEHLTHLTYINPNTVFDGMREFHGQLLFMAEFVNLEIMIYPWMMGVGKMVEAIAEICNAAPQMINEIQQLRLENNKLRQALETVEWIDESDGLSDEKLWHYCPWCGNYESSGHHSKCERQSALKKEIE